MTNCHLRDLRECPCQPGECRSAPPKAIAAPVIRFTTPQILLISAALGISSYFVGGWAIARAVEASHYQELAQQEQTHHG